MGYFSLYSVICLFIQFFIYDYKLFSLKKLTCVRLCLFDPQFPDELLKDSTEVVRALRKELQSSCEGYNDVKDIGLYVMADTTYGSCCVDEVGASHINADCVIHYGHTCLSP